MKKVSVLIISISNPVLVGIYENNILEEKVSLKGKTSDALPNIFDMILKKYKLEAIYYVNGPGSYMSIKVAYIFLKTLAITKKLSFKATLGFHFNKDSPIKALGKKYFIKDDNDKMVVDFLLDNQIVEEFDLPINLDENIFEKEVLPNYNLPAVY